MPSALPARSISVRTSSGFVDHFLNSGRRGFGGVEECRCTPAEC